MRAPPATVTDADYCLHEYPVNAGGQQPDSREALVEEIIGARISHDPDRINIVLSMLSERHEHTKAQTDIFEHAPSQRLPFQTEEWYRRARKALLWYGNEFRKLDGLRRAINRENQAARAESERLTRRRLELWQDRFNTILQSARTVTTKNRTLEILKNTGAVSREALTAAQTLAEHQIRAEKELAGGTAPEKVRALLRQCLREANRPISEETGPENATLQEIGSILHRSREDIQKQHTHDQQVRYQEQLLTAAAAVARQQIEADRHSQRERIFIDLLYTRNLLPIDTLRSLWAEIDQGVITENGEIHARKLQNAVTKLTSLQSNGPGAPAGGQERSTTQPTARP